MEDGSEEEWVEALVTAGLCEAQPPVLFFQEDIHLLMVSRHRRRLAQAFRFALPEADFIEQLVDKARFQRLSEERALPVPRTRVLHPTPDSQPPALDLRYPLVVKPLTRLESWATIERGGKALALGAAESVKRTHLRKAEDKHDWLADSAQSLEAIRETLEFKTTWHPVGA
jgi:predicted ATP-grasp superfamily ATP-dependent carboligase